MKDKTINWIKEHKYLFLYTIIPIIIFTILFLCYYPGIITYDGQNQWNQIQSNLINDAHPFFSTYFMYLLSKIHNTTTIVIIYQMFIFSIMWGIFCYNIKCDKKYELIKIIFTILFCLTPIIGIYSITLWKDILYTYYLFFISAIIYKGINNNFKYNILDYILLGILLFLVYSYRHNGIIVSILFIIIMYIILFVKRKKTGYKYLKKSVVVMFVFISLLTVISIPKSIMLKKYDASLSKEEKEVSTSAIDHYSIWMMGAHITDNNINDSDDLKFLNKIIPIETWKNIYDPYIINSTITSVDFNKKYYLKHKEEFISMFIDYSMKNPSTIAKHYLKSDALLINPISIKQGYVYIFDFSEWGSPYGFEAKINSKIPTIKNMYNNIINYSLVEPLNLLYQPAIWLYLSIILTIVLAKKVYGKKIWLFILPMLLNTISLLPINLAQDLRYVYINFITFGGILLLFIINYKKIFVKK